LEDEDVISDSRDHLKVESLFSRPASESEGSEDESHDSGLKPFVRKVLSPTVLEGIEQHARMSAPL
jgi:hypothetical protein